MATFAFPHKYLSNSLSLNKRCLRIVYVYYRTSLMIYGFCCVKRMKVFPCMPPGRGTIVHEPQQILVHDVLSKTNPFSTRIETRRTFLFVPVSHGISSTIITLKNMHLKYFNIGKISLLTCAVWPKLKGGV